MKARLRKKLEKRPLGPRNREAHKNWDYWIRRVKPLKNYKLLVTFHGGLTKKVDIKQMCWGYRCFLPVFHNFTKAQNENSCVIWPTKDNQVEIASEDLFLGRKPISRTPPDPNFSLDMEAW